MNLYFKFSFEGTRRLVSGVITQGARHTPDYVVLYRVSYSLDGHRWNVYKENDTERVTCSANGILYKALLKTHFQLIILYIMLIQSLYDQFFTLNGCLRIID